MVEKNNILKNLTFILGFVALILLAILINIVQVDNVNNENSEHNEKMKNEENKNLDENPIVVFESNQGTFEMELFLEESPITAGNFKKLVEEGFYDNTKFHRVIKNFMVQGGDPLSKNDSARARWGSGGPGYSIQDEFIEGLSNIRGTIAMANSGPNSGGSQFFINVVHNTYLDWDKAPTSSKHPVFGKVISGMDIVDKIANLKTASGDKPTQDVVLTKVYLK